MKYLIITGTWQVYLKTQTNPFNCFVARTYKNVTYEDIANLIVQCQNDSTDKILKDLNITAESVQGTQWLTITFQIVNAELDYRDARK